MILLRQLCFIFVDVNADIVNISPWWNYYFLESTLHANYIYGCIRRPSLSCLYLSDKSLSRKQGNSWIWGSNWGINLVHQLSSYMVKEMSWHESWNQLDDNVYQAINPIKTSLQCSHQSNCYCASIYVFTDFCPQGHNDI